MLIKRQESKPSVRKNTEDLKEKTQTPKMSQRKTPQLRCY